MENILEKHILIIDDDERMLRALGKTLRNEGAVVIAAQFAQEAIQFLSKREKLDLIITDLRMPQVTGAMLIQLIHQILPDLPIIVLTAFGSYEAKAECLRQGATVFLEKNLSSANLIMAIRHVFAAQKWLEELPQSAAH